MSRLKVDYKNDRFEGKRKYRVGKIEEDLITLDDITEYAIEGDIFNADDINQTNTTVNALSDSIQRMCDTLIVTLPVSGWGDTAPYTQTVTIAGMTSNMSPIPGMLYPDNITETIKAGIDKSSAMITEMETIDGALRVTCKLKKPIEDLIICLKGV